MESLVHVIWNKYEHMSTSHISKPYHAVDNFVVMIGLKLDYIGIESGVYGSFAFVNPIHDILVDMHVYILMSFAE